MIYPTLLVVFAVFTLLDALITVVGIKIGCIEINPIVTTMGIPTWVIFRTLLLACMLAIFFFGYRLLLEHSLTGTRILRATLFMLDFYIATVVFSGLTAICIELLL